LVAPLQLFGHPFSSYTWKALIPLYANETPFEFRSITPGDQDETQFLRRVHPAGKFPVLVDGDTIVIEATSIIEYLAVHHAGPAPLIPTDPAEAVTARMLDRVFDNYVMGNLQRAVAAYFVDKDDPAGRGLRDEPDTAEVEAVKARLRQAYSWVERWLSENVLPPHVSLVTCAAAPSLFYADWIERIPDDCPRLAALRAELLALPAVSRCIEDARPYRAYFPPGAPDRD
jgi:glutathione S-transferase